MKNALIFGEKSMPRVGLTAIALQLSMASSIANAQMLEEVMVTATKRSASVQEVPAAITAISGQALSDRALFNVADLKMAVPNLSWGEHFGTTMISIRGVGSTVDSGITEPTIAMYVDGVFLPRSTMSTLRTVDLERIEVLRGPQGTLYGRNATGGAINFISKTPSDEFEAGVNVGAGSRDGYGYSGYVSGPLSDEVSYRLSGGHEDQDGYVKVQPSGDRLGGNDVDYVRGALRISPTDDLIIDLAVRYEQQDAANAWQQLLTSTFLPTQGQTTEVNEIIADQPFSSKTDTTVANATIAWDISEATTLKSITSYVDHNSKNSVDADATDLDGFNVIDFDRPSESYAQEFNLSGESEALKWLFGAYLYHEEATVKLPLRLGPAFAPGFGVPIDTVLSQSVDSETDSYAFYTDLTYSISDALRLVAGLRYNDEKQDFKQDFSLNIPGVGAIPGGPAYADGPVHVDTSSSDLLPKIALQYDLSDDVTSYLQWSEGVKSGGLNLESGAGLSVGDQGLFDPEKIYAYEMGLKSQLFDNTLTANVAAYYYDYSDLQVTITVPPTTTLVQNADADIYGIESEFVWAATEQMQFNLAATYNEAEFNGFTSYDDAHPELGVQDLDGYNLPRAPKKTVQFGAQYVVDVGANWLSDITLRADVLYSDEVVLRYFAQEEDTQDSYTLTNLTAVMNGWDGNVTLTMFAKNIGDEEYKQNVSYIGAIGAYVGNYAPPRTYGATLEYRF